jgi:hypothetical protein
MYILYLIYIHICTYIIALTSHSIFSRCSTRRSVRHTSAHVSIRQHTSAFVSIRQHVSVYVHSVFSRCSRRHSVCTSAYVSIRQHTSAYVSIRQHTSAYVSIRQPLNLRPMLNKTLCQLCIHAYINTCIPGNFRNLVCMYVYRHAIFFVNT